MLRIKKLERELATSNMLLGQATEDIDTLEAEKQAIKNDTLRMFHLKDRIIKELEARQRGTSIPKGQGSGNESGGEGNQQLRAKMAELQERSLMLEQEILSLKRKFAHNQSLVDSRMAAVYSDLVAFNRTINNEMKTFSDLIKDEMKALSGMFSGVDDKLSVFSSTAEEELKAFCREAAAKLKSVGAKTRPGKDEKVFSEKLGAGQVTTTSSGADHELRTLVREEQGSGSAKSLTATCPTLNAKVNEVGLSKNSPTIMPKVKADGKDMVRPGKVLPEKVPRSSAETELLRLKDRRTLHRLASM